MREGWREADGIVNMSPVSAQGSVPLRTSGKQGRGNWKLAHLGRGEAGALVTTWSLLVSHQSRAASERGVPSPWALPCAPAKPTPMARQRPVSPRYLQPAAFMDGR